MTRHHAWPQRAREPWCSALRPLADMNQACPTHTAQHVFQNPVTLKTSSHIVLLIHIPAHVWPSAAILCSQVAAALIVLMSELVKEFSSAART